MRQALVIHPDGRSGAVRGVDIAAVRARPQDPSQVLSLEFAIDGAIADLRLPPPAESTRADELWQHTCFEAFLRAPAADAYFEFNFSPSTQWAAYAFESYRSGMRPVDKLAAPRIAVRASAERYVLRVELDCAVLSAHALWLVGLSAIIEEADGVKSYWALAHPPGAPDFHHADCFALQLPAEVRP